MQTTENQEQQSKTPAQELETASEESVLGVAYSVAPPPPVLGRSQSASYQAPQLALHASSLPVVQRSVVEGTATASGFAPYTSDAADEAALLTDARQIASWLSDTPIRKIVLMTQLDTKVYDPGSNDPVHTFRPSGILPPESVMVLAAMTPIDDIRWVGSQGGRTTTVDAFLSHEEEQGGQRSMRFFSLTDYIDDPGSRWLTAVATPALVVVRRLPIPVAPNEPAPWAQAQVARVKQALHAGQRQSVMARNTVQDQTRPDRLILWARDGRSYVNVWVGQDHQALELHEGQAPADLQGRIARSVRVMRGRRNEQAEQREREHMRGAPLTPSTYAGGTASGESPINAPAYRADIAGPDLMVKGGIGTFNMRLHYEAMAGTSLLSLMAEAYGGADYIWEVIDITALYQQVMRERVAAIARQRDELQRGMAPTAQGPSAGARQLDAMSQQGVQRGRTVGRTSAADRRRGMLRDQLEEDERQAQYDLTNPIETSDGSAGTVIRNVLANTFSLATADLHTIFSYGGWLVQSFPAVFILNEDHEREIPFPEQEGYYLVRCIAQPRPKGPNGEIIHAPSVATKVVEVRQIERQTRSELEGQQQNLEARILELLTNLRLAESDRDKDALRSELRARVQEAAQGSRTFLDQEIRSRQEELARVTEPAQQAALRDEIALLQGGTTAGSGTVGRILTEQLALKEQELARETDVLRRRRLTREVEALRERLATTREREAEFSSEMQIVRPYAVFVNEEDGQTFPLLIEIGQMGTRSGGVYNLRISDLSTPNGDTYDAQGPTRDEALHQVLLEFAGHFPYGRGYLSLRVPSGAPFRIRQELYRCNPRNTAQASQRLDDLVQALTILGLFVAPVGIVAGAIGTAMAVARLINRISNHTFRWDMEAVGDMIAILGAVASGVSQLANARLVRTQRLFAVVADDADVIRLVDAMSRTARGTAFINNASDWGVFLFGQMQIVHQFLDIQRQEAGGEISRAEARRRRAQLMSQVIRENFIQHAAPRIQGHGQGSHPQDRPHTPSPDAPHDGPTPHSEPRTPDLPPASPDAPAHDSHATPVPDLRPHTPADPVAPHTAPHDVAAPLAERNQRALALINDPARLPELLAGREGALMDLLRTHGTWRDLVMLLETQGEQGREIAANLNRVRDQIVTHLGREFQLSLSDPGASTHPSSDVDLATQGSTAGERLLAAEAYMRQHYGEHWSELLRMNFYTEGERLFVYERVRGMMSTEAFGGLMGRISGRAEVLNFAKMLQHAQGNTEGTARVERLMEHLTEAQRQEARTLATETPAAAAQRVEALHRQIDGLMARFEQMQREGGTSQQAELAHLAEQITLLQMEANFRMQEAYISPGAARQAVRGVAVQGHEAYQSALANLEMMEHILRHAGSPEAALREYELYKYINRFITAMTTAGMQPNAFMLQYLQTSHDVYRNSRTQLQGVGRSDMAFLRAMHEQFLREAQEALPELRRRAAADPGAWSPQARSLDMPSRGPLTHIGTRPPAEGPRTPEQPATPAERARHIAGQVRESQRQQAEDDIMPLPEDTVMMPAPVRDNSEAERTRYEHDAQQFLLNSLRDDPTREVAMYRNTVTGDLVVVQGREDSASHPEGDLLHRWQQIAAELERPEMGGGHWVMVAHTHPSPGPGRESTPLNRLPSGAGGDFTVIMHSSQVSDNTAQTSTIYFNTPRGQDSTRFGYDPQAAQPFWVEYPDPASRRRVRRDFDTLDNYQTWLNQTFGAAPARQTTPARPIGPASHRIMNETELVEHANRIGVETRHMHALFSVLTPQIQDSIRHELSRAFQQSNIQRESLITLTADLIRIATNTALSEHDKTLAMQQSLAELFRVNTVAATTCDVVSAAVPGRDYTLTRPDGTTVTVRIDPVPDADVLYVGAGNIIHLEEVKHTGAALAQKLRESPLQLDRMVQWREQAPDSRQIAMVVESEHGWTNLFGTSGRGQPAHMQRLIDNRVALHIAGRTLSPAQLQRLYDAATTRSRELNVPRDMTWNEFFGQMPTLAAAEAFLGITL